MMKSEPLKLRVFRVFGAKARVGVAKNDSAMEQSTQGHGLLRRKSDGFVDAFFGAKLRS